MVKLEYDITTI
jgi:Kinesin motor domain